MNFWWRVPIAVAVASVLTSAAYLAAVGWNEIGGWNTAGTLVLVLTPLFGQLFVVFVIPTTVVLRLLKVRRVMSSVLIVALCVVIDVYLYVIHFRMPLGEENIGSYLYGSTAIGLIGGLGYVAVQYLTLPSTGPWSRSRGPSAD